MLAENRLLSLPLGVVYEKIHNVLHTHSGLIAESPRMVLFLRIFPVVELPPSKQFRDAKNGASNSLQWSSNRLRTPVGTLTTEPSVRPYPIWMEYVRSLFTNYGSPRDAPSAARLSSFLNFINFIPQLSTSTLYTPQLIT